MYAAAGGASLASRKARQTKQKKTQQAAEKLAKEKATSGLITPTRIQQSRQFHQLSSNYLRTPGGPSRKLSAASYAANSKYLLPIHEGNSGLHSHSHHHHSHHQPAQPGTYQHHLQQQHLHHHQQHHQHLQQQHHHLLRNLESGGSGGRPLTPRLVHRHDGEGGVIVHSHLTKSATATLPLVSQADDDDEHGTPPTTPLISINTTGCGDKLLPPTTGRGSLGSADLSTTKKINNLNALPIPQDSIIVTPATPIASPGHSPKGVADNDQQHRDENDNNNNDADGITDSKDVKDIKEFFGPGPFLERKCSFYRVRRLDAFQHYHDFNEDDNQSVLIPPSHELTTAQLHHYRDYTDDSNLIPTSPLPNGGSGGGHKWAQCAYCEEGICICEHIECAQGKAAWLERGRRCSVQDNNPASCQKKWIQDSSLAGSSDDEDLLGVLRGPSSFANAFLYVGLGTVAIGLVIAFVGTGEKGFKTVELRLIGPSLIGIGLICCILRICFCICPSHCISTSRRARKKNSNKVDADHTTSLLRGESKRVSIAKGPQKFPLLRKKSNNKMLNEGMEALRQIATTSLFLQNEQKPSTTTSNRIVPIIKEPEKQSDSPLEMKKLDTTALNISDITDDEDEDDSDLATGGGYTVTIAATTSSYHDNKLTNLNNNNINDSARITQQITTNETTLQRTPSKLGRQRVAINQQSILQQQQHKNAPPLETNLDNDTILMETSLMIINPTPPPSATARTTRTISAVTATTTNTNSFSNFSNNNNSSSSSKSTILSPPPSSSSSSHLPSQQQSLLTPSIVTTTSSSSYHSSIQQSNYQTTSALGTPPPTTTLLSPRSNYDLPSPLPHQQLSMVQQPGQILDMPSANQNFAINTNNSGYFGSKINIGKSGTISSSGNNEISQLLLTPSLLPGSTGPYPGQINPNSNYLNSIPSTSSSAGTMIGFNLNQSSSANLTTTTTEPSELVLSPSKLGQ